MSTNLVVGKNPFKIKLKIEQCLKFKKKSSALIYCDILNLNIYYHFQKTGFVFIKSCSFKNGIKQFLYKSIRIVFHVCNI